MAYGLKIWDKNGKVTYDSSMVTWNQVTPFYVPANTTTTITHSYNIPTTKEKLLMLFFVNSPPIDKPAVLPSTVFGYDSTLIGTNYVPALGIYTSEAVLGLVLMR